MSVGVLPYRSPTRKRSRWREWRRVLIVSAILIGPWIAWNLGSWLIDEVRLTREEHRLLAANRPQIISSAWSPTFASDNTLVLPNGQHAYLYEMDRDPQKAPTQLQSGVGMVLQKFRPEDIGYSVIRNEPDGTPVVQVWILSPSAYAGMCGNSNYTERREGSMLVWRNLGVILSEEGSIPLSPEIHHDDPISILGR